MTRMYVCVCATRLDSFRVSNAGSFSSFQSCFNRCVCRFEELSVNKGDTFFRNYDKDTLFHNAISIGYKILGRGRTIVSNVYYNVF